MRSNAISSVGLSILSTGQESGGRGLPPPEVREPADFPPLELLQFLWIRLRLGRLYKGAFRVNNDGRMFAARPTALFGKMAPFFLLAMDHAAYFRTGEEVPGNWDTWLKVVNVEIENGLSELRLHGVFYGEGLDWDNGGWRQIAAFSACILKPLEWAGLITIQETPGSDGRLACMILTALLWRSVLKLDTDGMGMASTRH